MVWDFHPLGYVKIGCKKGGESIKVRFGALEFKVLLVERTIYGEVLGLYYIYGRCKSSITPANCSLKVMN